MGTMASLFASEIGMITASLWLHSYAPSMSPRVQRAVAVADFR